MNVFLILFNHLLFYSIDLSFLNTLNKLSYLIINIYTFVSYESIIKSLLLLLLLFSL